MPAIQGIIITPLKKILDDRGNIMHMIRCDDPCFTKFGEIYFATIFPGAIKAWHMHTKITLNYAVIVGNIKLGLYDMRKDSPTKGAIQEVFIGEDNYALVSIPPGVANGYTPLGNKKAIVANCADMPHDPNEMIRIDPFTKDIPFNWGINSR
ncbi:MAG: dTDP-4-dehydrorhamnose 3,5-epimerase family protein [Nanoarchaeota archaeon]